MSRAENEESSSQKDARKIGPQNVVAPITRTKSYDSSVSGPYHFKAIENTPRTENPIQKQQGESKSSNKNLRTE